MTTTATRPATRPALRSRRRTRTVRRPRCGGCGQWVTRSHNGQPLEHVGWNGHRWVYTCHPVPPQDRPPQMDVPLPFGTYTCQAPGCGRQEDTANADQHFPLCTLCTEPVDNRTRTPEEVR